MIVYSVCSANNLHKAKVMATSLKNHHPEALLILCLLEESLHPHAQFHAFDRVILAKDLGIHDFDRYMFKYFVYEAATSLKALLVKYLFKQYPNENHFICMDTDFKIFNRFDDLFHQLSSHPIVITPHWISKKDHFDDYIPLGHFNTGIVCFSRSMEAERMVEWWANRCYHYCYYDLPLFLDQKWFDLAPIYFDVHVYKHPGYNMAAWNIHERAVGTMMTLANGTYYIKGEPLCCFHFSGMDGYLAQCLNRWIPDKNHLIYDLLDNYKKELVEMGEYTLHQIPWSYDYFKSGEKILSDSRLRYRNHDNLKTRYDNPFTQSNHSFL